MIYRLGWWNQREFWLLVIFFCCNVQATTQCLKCKISISLVVANTPFCGVHHSAETVTPRPVESIQALPSFKGPLGIQTLPTTALRASSSSPSTSKDTALCLAFVLLFLQLLNTMPSLYFLPFLLPFFLFIMYWDPIICNIYNKCSFAPSNNSGKQMLLTYRQFTGKEMEHHRFKKCGLGHTIKQPEPELSLSLHLRSPPF